VGSQRRAFCDVSHVTISLHTPACLPRLHTLQITHNKLTSASDIEDLGECPELSIVDLSHNKLDDPAIVDIFEKMPSLVSMSKTSYYECKLIIIGMLLNLCIMF